MDKNETYIAKTAQKQITSQTNLKKKISLILIDYLVHKKVKQVSVTHTHTHTHTLI